MDRLEKLKLLLTENPEDGFLQHAVALECVKAGNDDEAEKVFTTLLQQQPGYVGSYYHLGKLLERKGETEKAIDAYARGMEMAKQASDHHALGELRSALEELTE